MIIGHAEYLAFAINDWLGYQIDTNILWEGEVMPIRFVKDEEGGSARDISTVVRFHVELVQ